ncbi:MAG: hypothetical protein ACC645_15480 [Pirellulales bacterium]
MAAPHAIVAQSIRDCRLLAMIVEVAYHAVVGGPLTFLTAFMGRGPNGA